MVRKTLLFGLLLAIFSWRGQAQIRDAKQAPADSLQVAPAQPALHGVLWRDASNSTSTTGSPLVGIAHLNYYGGPVISNVHIVQVLWGSGSYDPHVTGAATPSIGNFYADITSSEFMDFLDLYNTGISDGTGQMIGHGIFDGVFQIVPSDANNGSTIDDSQIQAELMSQISAGHLPFPILDTGGHMNTVYMIFFPQGKTITLQGSSTCGQQPFCAYHNITSGTIAGDRISYGVHPDLQPGSCSSACGGSTVFNNYTLVASHELAESITDIGAAAGVNVGPPDAWLWVDGLTFEIGDICNLLPGSYVANGTTYTIQLLFSNAARNCLLPSPNAQGNTMQPGEVLYPGQAITSPDGQYNFIYQTDGNLVLHHSGIAIWNSGTNGRGVGVCMMQTDGNLVIYGPGGVALWSSGTSGSPGSHLIVQTDGNVVIYNTSGTAIWQTNTWVPTGPVAQGDTMQSGQVLNPGQSITSADGQYNFIYQTDGNLVLYHSGVAIWNSGTNGRGVGICIMQTDGNLVVYSPGGHALWWSGTNGNPGSHLVVQTDGNVAIYRPNGQAIWNR